MLIRSLLILPLALLGLACTHADVGVYQPAATTQPLSDRGLTAPKTLSLVNAICPPPAGWQAAPPESAPDHTHQFWVSPSGKTAYGVLQFPMPLPVPATWIIGAFLEEMKKREGRADLIGKPLKDENLPGLRFVVENNHYKMRINLICRGFRGWAIYAGTTRGQEEVSDELGLAERARENTQVGVEK